MTSLSRLALLVVTASLFACPGPAPVEDAGVDAGRAPTTCAAPPDCRVAGVEGVCRAGLCQEAVPCADDVECGLGERCVDRACRFTGCLGDGDCPSGKCLTGSYSCAECGVSADCPSTLPVCEAVSNTCVQCTSDPQCPSPGPPYCTPGGACAHCTKDDHCPNGLNCRNNLCEGAQVNRPCPEGILCAEGLACVQLGGNPICLAACKLYAQSCAAGQTCFRLTYSTSGGMIFEDDGPVGVCFATPTGLRNAREPCTRSAAGTSCLPNLMCVPDSSRTQSCRPFCNPLASGTCPPTEVCTSFPGDYDGHAFGLCMSDSGFGKACTNDGVCRAGLSCQPYDDPSTFNDVSPMCQFDQGSKAGLAPCAPTLLPDGGVLAASLSCRSGLCAADPLVSGSPDFYCYAACAADSDCAVGTRTGFCDGTYSVTLPTGTVGSVKGCRPGCASTEACGEYDAGVECRLRLTTGSTAQLRATCSPPAASARRAGDACTFNADCRQGLCLAEDGRGVRRQGVCVEACTTSAQCQGLSDAGVVPVDCLATTLLGWRGSDGRAWTADDRRLTQTLCTGVACADDLACAADGGAVCGVDVDPADAGGVVTRCRRPASSGIFGGGQSCSFDTDCRSGLCGMLQLPSTGTGRACFEACTPATTCGAGFTCRLGGLRADGPLGPLSLDSCAP